MKTCFLNKPFLTLVVGGALLAGAGTAAAASTVKSVHFDYSANQAKQTVYQVRLINGQLTLMNPNVQMTLGSGNTVCLKNHSFNGGELYLGPVSESNGSLNKSQVALSDWTVNVDGYTDGEIVEAGGPPLIFDINVNAIQNSYFDPVKVVQAEMQKAMNGGMSEVAFLQKTRLFKADRIVSLAGKCVGNGSAGYKVDQQNVEFMVEYIGSPQVIANAGQIAAPKKLLAVPLGGNNTIQSAYGVTVHSGNLVTPSDYTGLCPKDLPFQAQVSAQGKGAMQIHLKRDGQALYTSPQFDYNGGAVNHPLTVKAELNGAALNELQSFKMNLYVRTRGEPGEPWSDYQEVSRKNWSQTCTPLAGVKATAGQVIQLAPNPGPQEPANSKIQAKSEPVKPAQVKIQAQPVSPSPAPKPAFKAQPAKPAPAPKPVVQAKPVSPSPAPKPVFQAQPVKPSPKPQLGIQAQPVKPSPQPLGKVEAEEEEESAPPRSR